MIKEKLNLQVSNEYEVAVCGGGIAGIAAALAAARNGKKTVLFERQFVLGGLATSGLITIYLPICDGFGKQVSYGIAEELLRLSVKYGDEGKYPENWFNNLGGKTQKDPRFEVQFNPHIFAILAEQLLIDAGVDILYGTYVANVKTKGNKIDYIITENKSGRMAYKINTVIDATGDCDIAKLAVAPTENFKQGNLLAAWYYSVGESGYNLNAMGNCDIPEEEKTEETQIRTINDGRFSGLDAKETSKMMELQHKVILKDFLKHREMDKKYWPVTISTIPQIRMSRKLVGEYILSQKELHTEFADSIGMVSNWKERGPIYEIPFRSLFNSKVTNLLVAGRCISVTDTMWDITRVIPPCAVTGQAAGTAAAICDNFSKIDIKLLQNKLVQDGVILHEKDI